MSKTNRLPEYSELSNQRIISAPGGLWQRQRDTGVKNTRDACAWVDVSRPLSYDEARSAIGGKMIEGVHPRRRRPRGVHRSWRRG